MARVVIQASKLPGPFGTLLMEDWSPYIVTQVDRFWSKVDRRGSCWVWLAAFDADGYGKFQINVPGENRQIHVRAHRFALAVHLGRMPDPKMVSRHRCDNRPCCNFDHLLLGTQKQNYQDAARRGRNARGERHGRASLTEAIVRVARERHAAGETVAALAVEFGVNPSGLYQAVAGQSWRWLRG